ncbi:MAG: hypothetical protein ABI947_22445 [Chloroflexota bacterium]
MRNFTKHLLMIGSLIAAMLLSLLQPSAGFAKQSAVIKYRYTYLTSVSDKLTIKMVNVNTGTVDILPADPPEGKFLYQVLTSPTGEWLALLFKLPTLDSNKNLIRLVNISSKETRDIILPSGQIGLSADHTWSPDGQYMAFEMQLDQGPINAYIYSIANDTLSPIITNVDYFGYYVWSNDSSQLAISQGRCPNPEECNARIETFDISTHTRKLSLDLAKLSLGYAWQEDVCNLTWSPGMRYVSFAALCDDSMDVAIKGLEEVYVWDTQTDKVSRLTSFTADLLANDKSVIKFAANYQTHWYDAQTLVVGAHWSGTKADPTEKTRIIAYNMANNTSRVLSSDFLYEFAINPVSRQIALKVFSPLIKKAADVPPYDERIVALTNDSGTFKLNTVIDVTGCHFAWSPDGAYLFFNKYTGPDCVIRADKFAFLDKSNNEVKLTLPAEEGEVTPIGWVVSPPSSATK